MRRLLPVALAALALAPAASAGGGAIAFGRTGGNIVPFRVTISASGVVTASGPVHVARTHLSPAALAALRRAVAKAGVAALPMRTDCPGTLPDVASLYATLGGRTVTVHGGCSPRFARAWRALVAAVGLSSS